MFVVVVIKTVATWLYLSMSDVHCHARTEDSVSALTLIEKISTRFGALAHRLFTFAAKCHRLDLDLDNSRQEPELGDYVADTIKSLAHIRKLLKTFSHV